MQRLSTVDRHGRIADREVIRALGWHPGTRLDLYERRRLIVASAEAQGTHKVTSQGRLHLPIGMQRWCGLRAGDRLLLSATHSTGILVICPPSALEAMVTNYLAATLGGENE